MLHRMMLAMTVIFMLVVFLGCATTSSPTPVSDMPQTERNNRAGAFMISANEAKTVYVEREGDNYKILRVEKGEKKAQNTIVFTYVYNPNMQILSVESNVDEQFITYDCYQVVGNKERKTSIAGAFKKVPSTEMWSDGVKLLRIENIRVAK